MAPSSCLELPLLRSEGLLSGGTPGGGDRPSTPFWKAVQCPPSGKGPPPPQRPPKLQEKPALGRVYFWSFNWLGKEVSLVKRDLTVGHSEFEGLRRKEREGLFPFIFPRAGAPSSQRLRPQGHDLNASPAGGSPFVGKSLIHLWEPERGFLAPKRKAFPSLAGPWGWAEGFPGPPSSAPQGEGCPSACWRRKAVRVSGCGAHSRPPPLHSASTRMPAIVGSPRQASREKSRATQLTAQTPLGLCSEQGLAASGQVFRGRGLFRALRPLPLRPRVGLLCPSATRGPGGLGPLAEGGEVSGRWVGSVVPPCRRVCSTRFVTPSGSCNLLHAAGVPRYPFTSAGGVHGLALASWRVLLLWETAKVVRRGLHHLLQADKIETTK